MTSVIVSSHISEKCERALRIRGFNPILLPEYPPLPRAIATHPDTLICRVGDVLITSADYCEYAPYVFSDIRELHPNIRILFSSDSLSDSYPDDCTFNALTLGGTTYAREGSISHSVIETSVSLDYRQMYVKQGYPACTTLAFESVERSFAITADSGMARVLRANGVSVTEITCGHIKLEPYEYGFIGGASGAHRDKIYFFGSLDAHPNAHLIRHAASEAGYECISLSDEPLEDLGGMIFID